MSTKPKPIKPRRMWMTYSHKEYRVHNDQEGAMHYLSDTPVFFRDPKERIAEVLVIDLSPESVEALVEKLAQHMSMNTVVPGWRNKRSIFRKDASSALAAIGIRPSRRKGSK